MTGVTARARLRKAFEHTFSRRPEGALFSPGRVNLIGEHIDYCGGLVLPRTISRGTHLAYAANGKSVVRVYSDRFDEMVTLQPMAQLEARGHWSDYVTGVARQLRFDQGVDIYVSDTIASGGLSSSASFSLGVARVMRIVAGREPAGVEELLSLAQLCQRAENEFVGVPCGIMDQASVALGGVIKLDCATLAFERVDVDFDDPVLVVMDTAKPRTLGASRYAERVEEIGRICRILGHDIKPSSLCREVTMDSLDDCCARLPPVLQRRLKHVVLEQHRVGEAFLALQQRDFHRLGQLMSQSHLSLKNNYEVTGDELDAIVGASFDQPGVLGARMTGAGFGGCAIALVAQDSVHAHNVNVIRIYRASIGRQATLFEV